jgi:hypothetical protein
MLANTSHHESFVKILQTFRAASAMQVPLLWKGDYLGVLICANAARGAYEEIDYRACEWLEDYMLASGHRVQVS